MPRKLIDRQSLPSGSQTNNRSPSVPRCSEVNQADEPLLHPSYTNSLLACLSLAGTDVCDGWSHTYPSESRPTGHDPAEQCQMRHENGAAVTTRPGGDATGTGNCHPFPRLLRGRSRIAFLCHSQYPARTIPNNSYCTSTSPRAAGLLAALGNSRCNGQLVTDTG